MAVAERASEVWSPDVHHYFPGSFRRSAFALMCVRHVTVVTQVPAAGDKMVDAWLPHGAWLQVLSYCGRGWFEAAGREPDDDEEEAVEQERRRYCEWCNQAPRKLKRCSKCGVARYCNAECLRKGWASHKPFCKCERRRQRRLLAEEDGAAAAH